MKTRCGFVSNSSSSSFCVVGKRVKLEDVDLSSDRQYSVIGKQLYDGIDLFELTEELLPLVKLSCYDGFQVYEVVEWAYDGYGGKAHIPEGDYETVSGTADMHSSHNPEYFKENYQSEPEDLLDMLAEGKITTAEYVKMMKGEISVQEAKSLLDDGLISIDEFVEVVAG